ncbi:hypothetical protein ABZ016_34490 [Streptomyces sp. NPDC006372]|uniref:hypothetical protein n=1 Tax=Streptomyces sp. NPDC006372 TaxID=3155599 RepID=UPI0033B3D2AA
MDHGMKHSSSVEVWPFALTRSVRTGFRIVAAPDFLVDEHRHSLLHDVTAGDPTEDAVYRREYRGRGSESLFLLYRVVYLKAADVGQDGEYAMSGPRRTPLIEGVVCRTPPGAPATQELLADVHRRCRADVRAFFEADTTAHPVSPCPSFAAPETGETLRVVDLDPYLTEPSPSEGSTVTAHPGRRPSRIPRIARALLSAVLSALGLRPDRQVADAGDSVPGEGGKNPVSPEQARGGGTGAGHPASGRPRRLARTAGAILLTVLVFLVIRKLK